MTLPQPGMRLKGTKAEYRVERQLDWGGGEGEGGLWFVQNGKPTPEVLKAFLPTRWTPARQQRLAWLVRQDLSRLSPGLKAPTDLVVDHGVAGHVAPFAEGANLNAWWAEWDKGIVCWSFREGLEICCALTLILARLEEQGISHGDLQWGNVVLKREGRCWIVSIIDLDNFIAPGLPAPEMAGQRIFLAPELRQPGALPTPESDRYALFILLHDIAFLVRPYPPNDDQAKEELERDGRWGQDPLKKHPGLVGIGGHPAEAFDPTLQGLFRRGPAVDPKERPTAKEWAMAFEHAVQNVYACDHGDCGKHFVIDSGKTICPHCRRPHPPLTLAWAGTERVIDQSAVHFGRDTFNGIGGADTVSKHHAVVRRHGPEVRIEDQGSRNGTFRWNGKDFVPLPAKKEIALRRGDRLKFGSVEVTVR